MRTRYSIIRTVIISIGAALLVAVVVTLYAVAPELHRIARSRTQNYLEQRFKSSVQFNDFHAALYPRIHIVIDGIVMRHKGRTDIPPLVQISALTMDGNFWDIVSAHPIVSHVDLKGLIINTPPRQPGGKPLIHGTDADLSKKFPVTISKITADEALLVILRRDTKPPHEFEIQQLEMDDVDFNNAAAFHALLTNPVPKGEIHCDGQLVLASGRSQPDSSERELLLLRRGHGHTQRVEGHPLFNRKVWWSFGLPHR